MKKSVALTAGVVIVLAGAWLGGTWYTGQRVADESQVRLDQINDYLTANFPGEGLKLEQLSYSRGFFSTQARYGLSAGGLPASILKPGARLEIDARVDHGPLPAGSLAQGHFLPTMAYMHAQIADTEAARTLFAGAQGKNPLSADAVLKYGGGASVQAEAAPLQLAEPKLSFGGARFDGDLGKQLSTVKGKLSLEPVTLLLPEDEQTTPMLVKLGPSVLDMDGKASQYGYHVGSSTLHVDSIDVQAQGEGGGHFAIGGLNYRAIASENGQFIDGQADFGLNSLSINGSALGSQQLSLKFARIDGAKVKAFNEVYTRLAAETAAKGRPQDDFDRAQIEQLVNAGLPLLADNPTIAIDPLVWKNDKGESRLNLTLTLALPAEAQKYDASFVRQAIKNLDLKLTLNKPMLTELGSTILQLQGQPPEAAAQQAVRQINNISGMAMMLNLGKLQGNDIISDLHYGNGIFSLNGRDMPVDALLGMLPQH
ncbi:YdgA family protein [Bordetella avium]|uniref:YdgA family protein n=1 Tax=Bordetella avium TaxID=521 RepID=UPI000E0B19BE|nr:YdgA family protein [Bordetella avium]RIQ14697.1 DUF945 family protein [Bordetella avium]RIQ54323.1 DUF945 family protein [Bordetella avium]RIQ62214.1 DUF945 family protein [Bordetella avium]RIQ63287.1 DUF945 family protein [Bordetella avium]RIQ82043.1 DUF945 family protein [Bordetella avium]